MIYLGDKAVKNVFLGDRPVARIYKGSDLVWEKEPQVDEWDSYVNFGQASDGTDIPGWDNIKATDLSSGGTFNGVEDTNGIPRMSVTVTPMTISSPSVGGLWQLVPGYPDLFERGWQPDTNSFSIEISGLTDGMYYTVEVLGMDSNDKMNGLWTVAGTPITKVQTLDIDTDINHNITFARFDNVSPVSGVISISSTVKAGATMTLYGIRVKATVSPVVHNSNYDFDMVPDTDVSNPPCAFFHAYNQGEENTTGLPLIVSLPMGGTEGDGEIDDLPSITSSNIMKAIFNRTFNPPSNVRVVAPQFYQNIDNSPIIADLIDYFISEYEIDQTRIYLMGFSAGLSNATYYLGKRGREDVGYRPIAAVLAGNSYEELDYAGLTFANLAASGTPIALQASTSDMVTVAMVEEIRDGLLAVNPAYPVTLSVLDTDGTHGNYGHVVNSIFTYGFRPDIPPQEPGYDTYVNGSSYSWLLSHQSVIPDPPEPGDYDEDFQAVIDEALSLSYAMPGEDELGYISDAVEAIKAAGIWAKADRLFIFATGATNDALFKSIDYIDPERKATPYSLTVDRRGFIGAGSGSYFDTEYNASTQGVNYEVNNAARASYCFKAFNDTAVTPTHAVLDSANANTNMIDMANSGSHRINSGTLGLGAGTFDMGGVGYKAINRNGANDVYLFNGKTRHDTIRASAGITNAKQFVLRRGSNYGTAGLSFYYIGASLTEQQNNDLDDIISELVSAVS